MSEKPFAIAREDGRSDRQVIYDLVNAAPPNTVFTYTELAAALSEGLPAPVALGRVYRSVTAANRELLRQSRRYLNVVRGTGYRILRAEEHLPAAIGRESRARRQIRRGLEILNGVREEELTPAQRQQRDGQLLITQGVLLHLDHTDKRLDRIESLIESLKHRMDQNEGSVAG